MPRSGFEYSAKWEPWQYSFPSEEKHSTPLSILPWLHQIDLHPMTSHILIQVYSWPLHNMGLICKGPWIPGFFSLNICYSTTRDWGNCVPQRTFVSLLRILMASKNLDKNWQSWSVSWHSSFLSLPCHHTPEGLKGTLEVIRLPPLEVTQVSVCIVHSLFQHFSSSLFFRPEVTIPSSKVSGDSWPWRSLPFGPLPRSRPSPVSSLGCPFSFCPIQV